MKFFLITFLGALTGSVSVALTLNYQSAQNVERAKEARAHAYYHACAVKHHMDEARQPAGVIAVVDDYVDCEMDADLSYNLPI